MLPQPDPSQSDGSVPQGTIPEDAPYRLTPIPKADRTKSFVIWLPAAVSAGHIRKYFNFEISLLTIIQS
jgi:hypothetical protein